MRHTREAWFPRGAAAWQPRRNAEATRIVHHHGSSPQSRGAENRNVDVRYSAVPVASFSFRNVVTCWQNLDNNLSLSCLALLGVSCSIPRRGRGRSGEPCV